MEKYKKCKYRKFRISFDYFQGFGLRVLFHWCKLIDIPATRGNCGIGEGCKSFEAKC